MRLAILPPKLGMFVSSVPAMHDITSARSAMALPSMSRWVICPINVVTTKRVPMSTMGLLSIPPTRAPSRIRGNPTGVFKFRKFNKAQPWAHQFDGPQCIDSTQTYYTRGQVGLLLGNSPRPDRTALENLAESPNAARITHTDRKVDSTTRMNTTFSVYNTSSPREIGLFHTCNSKCKGETLPCQINSGALLGAARRR